MASQASQIYNVEHERYKDQFFVVKTKPRDVFDIGNRESYENDVDTYCDNKSYNVIVENTTDDANNLNWARNDVDGTTIDEPFSLDNDLMGGKYMDYSKSNEDLQSLS